MKRADYLVEFEKLAKLCVATTTAKNADYADDNDAFANFRLIEALTPNISALEAVLVRMSDKLKRAFSLSRRAAKVNDEKIDDTLIDLATYSIIAAVLVRSLRK